MFHLKNLQKKRYDVILAAYAHWVVSYIATNQIALYSILEILAIVDPKKIFGIRTIGQKEEMDK